MLKKLGFILLTLCVACGKPPKPASTTPIVLVSIEPYRFLVEQIGLDAIDVQSIVPPNTNPHTFEPTSRQTAQLAQGSVWFQIGEPFENKISSFLKQKKPNLVIWDLREGIDLIEESGSSCHHCSKDHLDRHIWLSPKLAALQSAKIEKILSAQWPEKEPFFKKNLKKLEAQLFDLDKKIASRLKPLKNQTLLVSHPAFGYFCQEYGLKQLSVEHEGKDPRPRHLEKVMNQARTSGLKTALTLPQYNNKGTLLIAEKLHLKTQMINPYSSDYMSTMNQLSEMIAQ